jgi:hypothetical protein
MQASGEAPTPHQAFLKGAAHCLQDVPTIMSFAIMHQLNDLKCDVPEMTQERARKFIEGVVAALQLFVPPSQAERVREALFRELRRAYPMATHPPARL